MKNIEERLQAVTMTLELVSRDVEALRGVVERLVTASENLVNVAQTHERRLDRLEGQQ